jgi:hypothetical protein
LVLAEQTVYEGFWWFPNHPEDKLAGYVTFSEEEGYTLSIRGILQQPILEIYQESELTVFGKIGDKHDITAIVASFKSKNIRNFIELDIAYRLKFILFGFHFDKLENIRFSSMILKYSNLDKWFSEPRLRHIWKNEKKVFRYGTPIRLRLSNNTLKVLTYSLVDYYWDPETHKNIIKNDIVIKISLSKERTLLNYLDQHQVILDFFNFVCGFPIFVLTIDGIVKQSDTDIPVRVMFHSPITAKMNKIPDTVPYGIIYEVLFDTFHDTLKKWFAEKNNIENAYASFFGFMYNPHEYLSNMLLMLSAGIESYHEKFLENSTSKAKSVKDKKSRILKSITSLCISSEDMIWLVNTIKNRSIFSLASRISGIYEIYEDIIPKISRNMEDKNKFANEVNLYRNRFAHGAVVSKKDDDDHLFWTVQRLHFLLKLLILTHLGFSNTEILLLLVHQPIMSTDLGEQRIAEGFSIMEND